MAACNKLASFFIATLLFGLSAEAKETATDASSANVAKLRLAVEDLSATYTARYPDADKFLARLKRIETRLEQGEDSARRDLESLRREALLANPLLDTKIVLVKRKAKNRLKDIAIPAPHESNSGLERSGYDNEIAILDLGGVSSKPVTLFRPDDQGYVGEVDLHWDGERLLFTRSDAANWKLWEIGVDGSGLRQVSQTPDDVDCFDACYLPDDCILFASTASYQSVPCHHGKMPAGHLYRANGDGANMRQLCFDQDIDAHPVVLGNGQVMYSRWDYTGINHIFLRQLMVMNPDGTGQRAVYGSNTYFPNSLFFFRPLPGQSQQLVSTLSGYHGVPRMGWLVTLDTSRGWRDSDGITRRISGVGAPIKPIIKDAAVDADWPKFLHPYPLSDKHFLVSCLTGPKSQWGIYLADVFDNLLPLYEDPSYALLEPIAIAARPKPPVIPDRTDPRQEQATVYLHDVYTGPGLDDVPRGTIKSLRVLSYHFGYRGLAGSDKIGYGGPWDVMRIEGTIPIEADGSASFRVPANTPLALQPMDAEGKAVQLMRSWMTAMPGEIISCIGCHESPAEASPLTTASAALMEPRQIEPWYGPARGFDFAREVQPVLNRHCVGCHDGKQTPPDLRPEEWVDDRQTWPIGYPNRLDPDMKKKTQGRMTYTPAYDALVHYVRRVGIEDGVNLLVPGEYHADTSPLVQMIRAGHQGVELDREDWDRLITWIDLNAPCHGTWGDVFPIPGRAHDRRMELRQKYGGPTSDPESIPELDQRPEITPPSKSPPRPESLKIVDWPIRPSVAIARQHRDGPSTAKVDLGQGVAIELKRIPAGRFVIGSIDGQADEFPQTVVVFDQPYWMGTVEVTNAQFQQFDPSHDSGYYSRRLSRPDDKGLPLDTPTQPVVRVAWHRAMEYCRWLSDRTGLPFDLPTEAQWEYACRAGTASPLAFGDLDDDSSLSANVADETFSRGVMRPSAVHPRTVTQWSGGVPHLVLEGGKLAETRFRDGFSVTADVGRFAANAWGLQDMHGNAAEWTRSCYLGYPYRDDDGRNDPMASGRRVVRGGSFFDPPRRCRSASRVSYHPWHRVFNVGFRVVCNLATPDPKQLSVVTFAD